MDRTTRLLPAVAVFRHDLGSVLSGGLLRGWLVLSGLLTLMLLGQQWANFGNAKLIALVLFPYLVLPWFLVVIMLGVGPVAGSRAESLVDGILSRPITRYEYLLATWAARVAAVLGAFLVVVLPATALIVFGDRPETHDTATSYGILASLLVVCLVLTLLVSLAFLLGTLLRRSMIAVALLALGWLVSGTVLANFQLEELSPISLNQALPTLLKQPWDESQSEPAIDDLEDFRAVFKSFSGMMGMEAPEPRTDDRFFESEQFEDVALWRVTLGYALPTLLAIGLATLVFCRRDL